MYDFSKLFIRQGVPLGDLLCDRVQSVERFSIHPWHFSSEVPPSRGRSLTFKKKSTLINNQCVHNQAAINKTEFTNFKTRHTISSYVRNNDLFTYQKKNFRTGHKIELW